MERIIKLVIVVVILYFAYTEFLPWVKKELGMGTSSSITESTEGGGACVALAADASLALGVGIRPFVQPPINVNAWETTNLRIESRISEAESACFCFEPSCDKANEALSVLRNLLSELDGGFRGDSPMPLNGARDQTRADALLSEAEDLAREGS